MKAFGAALLILVAPTAGNSAAGNSCSVPQSLPIPEPDRPNTREPRRLMPVSGYTLALSWSPEHCRTRRNSPADRLQCGQALGRFGFILHGLWPDGRDGQWPQYCRPATLLPEAVLRANLCATPSVQLLQHEWAKHGTCMADDPARYLRAATTLYEAVRYPDMNTLSRKPLTIGAFAEAFAAANPGIDRSMIFVDANRRGWLREVRLCLSRTLRPRACPRPMREDAARRPLKIWRGG